MWHCLSCELTRTRMASSQQNTHEMFYPLEGRSETKHPGWKVSMWLCKCKRLYRDSTSVWVMIKSVIVSIIFYTALPVVMPHLVTCISLCFTAPSVYVAEVQPTKHKSTHWAPILHQVESSIIVVLLQHDGVMIKLYAVWANWAMYRLQAS